MKVKRIVADVRVSDPGAAKRFYQDLATAVAAAAEVGDDELAEVATDTLRALLDSARR